MRAIVLVGGFGTRMRPLTLDRPKPLLPLFDRPLITWVIERLPQFGVTEVVLSLAFQPDAFRQAFPDGTCAGVPLHYAVEPEPLDTAGAIAFAADDAGVTERCLVLNGDVLTDIDVSDVLALHEARGAEATIALSPVDDPSRFGVVPTDADGRVEAFVEKPPAGTAPTNYINAGIYVMEPAAIARITRGQRVNVEREIFPAIVADGGMYAVRSDAYWFDAGTRQAYVEAHLDVLRGRRPCDLPVSAAANWFGTDTDVDVTATVAGTCVSDGVVIGAGASVIDSVIGRDAVVEPGAVVNEAVVGEGAVVGATAWVSQFAVVGHGQRLAPGRTLVGDTLPPEESWGG